MNRTVEPRLTPEDEVDLAKDIEAGLFARHILGQARRPGPASQAELASLQTRGERARERFLLANCGLVGTLARKEARRSGLPFGDLYQEGFLGLMQALARYDFRRGGFAPYAAIWIRSQLAAAVANRCGLAYVSPGRVEEIRRLRGLESELTQRLGRSPTTSDLAEATGRSRKWVEEVLSAEYPRGLGPDVEEVPSKESDADPGEADVWRLVGGLSGLESEVVRRRYGAAGGRPRSYQEVGRVLGIDPTSARRAELRALARMRCSLQAEAAA